MLGQMVPGAQKASFLPFQLVLEKLQSPDPTLSQSKYFLLNKYSQTNVQKLISQPDPNDARLNSNNVVISNNARNKARNQGSGPDMALTEEELAFMNEHMGGDNSPGDSEVVGGSVSVKSFVIVHF